MRAIKVNKFLKKLNIEKGFTLIELIISLILTLIILGIAVAAFSSALSSRSRESSKTDAITSTQAALNIMTREIGNSGYGLSSNGIVVTDSDSSRLHFRTNVSNNDYTTDDPGEDVTFYHDTDTQSVVRFDDNLDVTSGVINRVSQVTFSYSDYNSITGVITSGLTAPSADTYKVTITLKVILEEVTGQPTNQEVEVKSDIILRNSTYILGKY